MNLLLSPTTGNLDSSMVAKLKIHLLQSNHILLDGTSIRFPYDHVLALLVYLAVESDRSHRRSALAGLLWPEQPEHAARHSLSQALFSLRRTLHGDPNNLLIIATRDSVRFNTESWAWCDVIAFRKFLNTDAEQAIALYNSDFLEGLSVGGSTDFEGGVVITRE